MRIKVRENSFGDYDILEVEERERILEEIVKCGVPQVLAEDFLNAYLDSLRGTLTKTQEKILFNYEYDNAYSFLGEITEVVQ
jgi:hypothetical protein